MTIPKYPVPGEGSSSRERYAANPAGAWVNAVICGIGLVVALILLLMIVGTGDLLWLALILVIVVVYCGAVVVHVIYGWLRSSR